MNEPLFDEPLPDPRLVAGLRDALGAPPAGLRDRILAAAAPPAPSWRHAVAALAAGIALSWTAHVLWLPHGGHQRELGASAAGPDGAPNPGLDLVLGYAPRIDLLELPELQAWHAARSSGGQR